MNTGGVPRSSDSNSFPRRVTYHLSKTTHVLHACTYTNNGRGEGRGSQPRCGVYAAPSAVPSARPGRSSRRPWGTPRCHVHVNHARFLLLHGISTDGKTQAKGLRALQGPIVYPSKFPVEILLKRGKSAKDRVSRFLFEEKGGIWTTIIAWTVNVSERVYITME